MTLKQAKAIAKENGCSLRHNHWDREYRVNLIGGTEETAYYTNDREDAVNTAIAMNNQKKAGVEYIEVGLCCDDCVIAIANDDYSGMDDAQESATRSGIEAIGQHLIVGSELGFSCFRCDVCNGLAGNRHEVGYIRSNRV